MSAKRTNPPRIVMVGAGNLASALSLSLHAAGYKIEHVVSRSNPVSLRRAQGLAREVHAAAVPASRARISAQVVWFGVPDGMIAATAQSLVKAAGWNGKIALHSSGALTSDELDALRRRGAAVASVHPLMTFVRGSRPQLAGVPFAIEGDAKAVRAARAIVSNLGAKPFKILKHHKQAYHAWGMFASPLLTALLAVTERVAGVAGVSPKAARQRMLPILRQTLANYEGLGARATISGPIKRGDVATVSKHLKVLRNVPGALEIYIALARASLRDLPAKNRTALKKMLGS